MNIEILHISLQLKFLSLANTPRGITLPMQRQTLTVQRPMTPGHTVHLVSNTPGEQSRGLLRGMTQQPHQIRLQHLQQPMPGTSTSTVRQNISVPAGCNHTKRATKAANAVLLLTLLSARVLVNTII